MAIICGSIPALKAFISKVFFGLSVGGSSGGNNYGSNQYGATSQSRKQSRNQSQALGSQIGDEERGKPGLAITVQSSIEMKTYLADDTGSEKELITEGHESFVTGGKGGQRANATSRRTVVEANPHHVV